MRERLISTFVDPKPTERAARPAACPYLGLANDAFNHQDQPSPEHRCYLWMQRERIDVAHQQRFCLTTAYSGCPWMAVSRPASGSEESPWNRLGETLRERFDELERVTMRSSWPRAVLALLVFLFQLSVQCAREGRRLAGPSVRHVGRLVGRFSRWYWYRVHPRLVAFFLQAARGVLVRERPVEPPAAPLAEAQPAIAVDEPLVASSGDLEPAPEPPAAVQPPSTRAKPAAPANSGRRRSAAAGWECAGCLTANAAANVFCQRCGRLSADLEQDLRVRGAFQVLEGLKAMQAGDEEVANRRFAAASLQRPDDELAWLWRSRTAGSMEEVVLCLENLLRLKPDDPQLQADLEIARMRAQIEATMVERAPAKIEDVIPKKPAAPGTLERVVAFVRRLALELASVPAFLLGVLLFGQPTRDALAMFGLGQLDALIPVFHLPALLVSTASLNVSGLPPGLVPPMLNLSFLLPAVVAIWYLRLAFKVADGHPVYRHWAMASGFVALGTLPLISRGGYYYLLASLLLLVLAGLGKGETFDQSDLYPLRASPF